MAEVIPMPVNLATLPPEKKLEYLEQRIRAVRAGDSKKITCPYCGEMNKAGDAMCCELFMDACDAIITRIEQQDQIDFLSNVADKAMVH